MNEKVEFDVIINGKKARAVLKDVENDQKKLEKTTVKSNTSMSDSWAVLGLKIAAATIAMKAGIEAYSKQIKAETSLTAAMKNNTALVDTNTESWKAYASSIQEWANIGDEVTIKQLAFLNTLGLTDEQMKAIIQTSADLANTGMMPFDSAVRNLAKSLSGMSGELGEMFPVLREFTAEQLKAGEGITAIAEAVKGQSEAIANSPIGKWDAMWNAAGDTMEKVGESILSILNNIGVLDFAKHVFEQTGFGIDLLGLRFEWMGEKVKELWNILTFDQEEANQASQRAIEIEEKYITVLQQSKDALAGKKVAIEENAVATNLQADATNKALAAEEKALYAAEMAANGYNELGEEIEVVTESIEEANDAIDNQIRQFEEAEYSAESYAQALNKVSQAESGIGTNQVTEYSRVSTANEAFWDSMLMQNTGAVTGFDTSTAMPGFASGGYTGDMASSSIAGVVHGGEYVVNSQTTKDLGLNGSGGTFSSMDDKLSLLYDINKSLIKVLRHTKDNSDKLERIATA